MTKVVECDTSNEEYVKKFAKRMLKTHVFTGTFIEQRFVEPLNSYRDVIKIDKTEDKFIQNVLAVKRKIEQSLTKKPNRWIGVTEPDTIGAPAGYNVWTVLPVEIFGKYWYHVKTVEFLDNEIRLKLAVIREVKDEKVSTTPNEDGNEVDFATELSTSIQKVPNQIKANLIYFYLTYLTLENFKASVVFLSVLIGMVFAAGISTIKYLLEYLLKLISELRELIKVCSPIIITCLNIIGRTTYGLIMSIMTLFRKGPPPQEIKYNYYIDPSMMQYADNYRERYNKYSSNGRAIPYPRERSGAYITPLEQ